MAFFNYWSPVILIGNVLMIIGTILLFASEYIRLYYAELLIAVGSFMHWISLTSFVEHAQRFSFISRTMSYSFFEFLKNIVATAPIFLGFSFLALCLFWQSNRFREVGISAFTLFGLMNGDEISNVFEDVTSFSFIMGIIFFLLFTFFSISVIANLFLIIIGDSYMIIKERAKYDWLREEGRLEEL